MRDTCRQTHRSAQRENCPFGTHLAGLATQNSGRGSVNPCSSFITAPYLYVDDFPGHCVERVKQRNESPWATGSKCQSVISRSTRRFTVLSNSCLGKHENLSQIGKFFSYQFPRWYIVHGMSWDAADIHKASWKQRL